MKCFESTRMKHFKCLTMELFMKSIVAHDSAMPLWEVVNQNKTFAEKEKNVQKKLAIESTLSRAQQADKP